MNKNGNDPTDLNIEPGTFDLEFEETVNKDGVISAASLPDEFQVKDPFDPNWLMTLPKEALVAVIRTFSEGYIKHIAAQRIVDIAKHSEGLEQWKKDNPDWDKKGE